MGLLLNLGLSGAETTRREHGQHPAVLTSRPRGERRPQNFDTVAAFQVKRGFKLKRSYDHHIHSSATETVVRTRKHNQLQWRHCGYAVL